MYRLEVYKLWLGFLEKMFLLLLAVAIWAIIGAAIFVAYASLSIKARHLADIPDTERKQS